MKSSDDRKNDSLTIGVICGAPPHVQDGVGDFAWLLARELTRQFSIHYLAPRWENTPSPEVPDGISMRWIQPGWNRAACEETDAWMEKLRPNVLLVHFVPQLYGWNGAKPSFALLLRKLARRGYRIVTVAHEFYAPFGPSPKTMVWSAAQRILWRLVLGASRKVVVTTPFVLEQLRADFPSRRDDFTQIPAGCPIPVVPVSPARRLELRSQLGIGETDFLITTLGGVPDSLEKLFDRAHRETATAKLLVIGKSGNAVRERLSQNAGIRDAVLTTGTVTNTAMSEYLSLSDLYVALIPDGASARRTSFLVGLAHGLPTVTNAGPLTDVTLKSSEAFCLLNGDCQLNALQLFCNNTERRNELGILGKKFFAENFSWEMIGRRYADSLTEVAR